ncbi:hypothetical protein ACVEVU_000233 [Morganella morganii]
MTHKLWLATALLPILLSGCAAPLPPAQTQENCPDFTGVYQLPLQGESQSIALTLLDKSTNQYGVGVKDKNGVDHFTSRPYKGDMVRMDKKEMNGQLACSVMIDQVGLIKPVEKGGPMPGFPGIARNDDIKMATGYALFIFSPQGIDYINLIKTSDVVPMELQPPRY